MKHFLLGTLLSMAVAAPLFAALKQGDTAADFSTKASPCRVLSSPWDVPSADRRTR